MQTIIELYQSLNFWQLVTLSTSAILIGINKTGIPGIGTLPVVLLALNFEPGLGTGIQLIMLCAGDLIALSFYRKIRPDWGIILRLLPFALLGITLAYFVLQCSGDTGLRPLIGWIIIVLAAVKIIKDKWENAQALPGNIWMAMIFGTLTGFTTQLANAAGPIMALFLLAIKLPSKEKYMATCVWLFLILNYIKLPIFIAEGRISITALAIDLPLLLLVFGGGLLGVLFIRKIPQKYYEAIIEVAAVLAAIKLLLM